MVESVKLLTKALLELRDSVGGIFPSLMQRKAVDVSGIACSRLKLACEAATTLLKGLETPEDSSESESKLPEHWEELDDDGHYFWGVFQAEGLSPYPIAIFPRKEDAHQYMDMLDKLPEDVRQNSMDMCVMACVINGITFNNYNEPPENYFSMNRVFWRWIEEKLK